MVFFAGSVGSVCGCFSGPGPVREAFIMSGQLPVFESHF
jgi:hypothetical protein